MMADENPHEQEQLHNTAPESSPESAAEGGGGGHPHPQLYNNEQQLSYVGGFFSAMVLLVSLTAGSGIKGQQYYAYGIAVASVTMFFSLVGWVLSHQGASMEITYINYFLFAWNFIGACFMTFGSPFTVTGNGYFASWAIAVFAVMGVGVVDVQAVKSTAKTPLGSLLGLFASAVVLTIAILSKGFSHYHGELIFSIILAGLTIVVVLVFTKMVAASGSLLEFPILALLAVLWIVSACLLTFRGPFLQTGNGYFSAWAGAVTAVFAAMGAKNRGGGAFQGQE